MKMVKSLLLGSAAGLVAVAGAQAADLPVKAKPVQYVKICALYGVGFYYIPGTDTCIKIGGWLRTEVNVGSGGSFNPIVRDLYDRDSDNVNWRVRGMMSFDVRSQTEYGTLRSYILGGWQSDNSTHSSHIYAPRAFIQLAGFTVGLASSFFDFYATPWYSNTTNIWGSDTGGGGDIVWAYTAQFGNGFSATLSAEDPTTRRTAIWRTNQNPSFLGTVTNRYIGANGWPDVVANLRVDQAWGSAQVMGAAHQVAADYYGATEASGHPSDDVGFAVGAGLKLNIPWGKGDSFAVQGTYSEGALKYVGSGLGGFGLWNGADVAIGWVTDAVYSPVVGSDLQLTTGWSVVAGIDHHWDPHWKTSLYGTYGEISYNSTATTLLNTLLCGTPVCAGGPDFQFWQVGSRTVWTPVQNLDLSVDVMYNQVQTSYAGNTINPAFVPAAKLPGPNTVQDEGVWQVIFRAQRNFYP